MFRAARSQQGRHPPVPAAPDTQRITRMPAGPQRNRADGPQAATPPVPGGSMRPSAGGRAAGPPYAREPDLCARALLRLPRRRPAVMSQRVSVRDEAYPVPEAAITMPPPRNIAAERSHFVIPADTETRTLPPFGAATRFGSFAWRATANGCSARSYRWAGAFSQLRILAVMKVRPR
jgi:hypothetical protein